MITDTNIQSILLIMNKERTDNDPVYFYDISGVKKKTKDEKILFQDGMTMN